jgi:GT2 family glycosyltransferase/tetratricopeptide (TPR) repeat protein
MTLESEFQTAAGLAASGETERALAAFEGICARWPGIAVAQANRGVLLRRLDRRTEALDALAKAARLAPAEPDRWVQLASVAHEIGDMRTTVSALRRVLTLAPNSADALYDLGLALPMIGRRIEAARALRRRIVLNPGAADAWVRLARAEARLGHAETPILAALQSALVLDPANLAGVRDRALRTGREDANARWHVLAPRDGAALQSLVDRLIERGERTRARDLLIGHMDGIDAKTDERTRDALIRAARASGVPDAALSRTAYERWVERTERSIQPATPRADAPEAPLISILLPVCDPPVDILRETLQSVRDQSYPHWQLCIADDASRDPRVVALLEETARSDSRMLLVRRADRGHISAASNSALALASGSHVGLLDHDDLLTPDALAVMADTLMREPSLGLIYSDEDKIDPAGNRFDPHFKPDWDPDRIVTQNYICHFLVARADLVRRVGGFRQGLEGAQDHDLVLRLSERLTPAEIRHIPRILYHWRVLEGSTALNVDAKPYAARAGSRAAAEHLKRSGRAARLRSERGGGRRVIDNPPHPAPHVRAVIATRDRLDLLHRAVDGLLSRTDYPALDLVILDNGSREPGTERYLSALSADPRVTILDRPGPFNFSALMNEGADVGRPVVNSGHALGPRDPNEVLLFLNNDVEPAGDPRWLTEMVAQASRADVGVVGALLLYPDRTVQHAGVALAGDWVSRHLEVGEPDLEGGYRGRRRCVQTVSAVTGACMAIRRRVFEAVGGFEADQLAVDFSDVDLCLKAAAAGYRTVFTPFAKLIHHESATRGPYMSVEKRERWEAEAATMRARWGETLPHDPFYNPNLAIAPGTKTFGIKPPN